MNRIPKGWISGIVLGLLLGTMVVAVAEDLTVTTYYPSPRGVYDELRSRLLRVEEDAFLAVSAAGDVGIGTITPTAKLDVQNGNTNLGGNLTVTGNSALTGTLNVTGASTLATTNTGPLTVAGATNLTGTLNVTGASTLATTTTGTLTVNGAETVNGNAVITGLIRVQGGAPVAGQVLRAQNGSGDADWDWPTYAP